MSSMPTEPPTMGAAADGDNSMQQQQLEQRHCCRREFHALFFGRRQSSRYRQHQTEAAAADLLADPFRLAQQQEDEIQERKQRINKQLRVQLLLGGSILLVFVATFSVIISLLMIRDDASEYLRMEPRLGPSGGGHGHGIVRLDRHNDDDLAGVLARIRAELSDYEIRRWYPRMLRSGRRPKDCDGLGAYPMPGHEICVPQLSGQMGACNLYTAFGYLVGDPCVLVRPGPALASNFSEDLLLSCSAALVDPRGEELELKYYPRVAHHGQMYGYFPRFYFPYPSDESFYLAPLVMVQIIRPPRGRDFLLNCSLANAALANASTQSSLHFLFD